MSIINQKSEMLKISLSYELFDLNILALSVPDEWLYQKCIECTKFDIYYFIERTIEEMRFMHK